MATNLQSISNLTTGINSFSNLILINPQTNIGYYEQIAPTSPGTVQSPQDVTGWLFDYEGENAISLESDITDHYVEDNTTRSDQIAIRPVVVNVQGFIGELTDVLPKFDLIGQNINTFGQYVSSKLQTLSAYTPELSTTGLIALNEAFLAYQVAANAASTIQQTLNLGGDEVSAGDIQFSQLTKQQQAFARLYNAHQSKVLFTIQTPWAIFRNMAIRSLRAIQSAETRMITDFEIQFKRIQYVSETEQANREAQNRLSCQSSSVINFGSYTPKQSSVSSGDAIQDMLGDQ